MSKEIMDRRAADNAYLHRDFHISMKMALDYCHQRYGDEGVLEYLRTFSSRYFKPLSDEIRSRGLAPLVAYFKEIYAAEEAEVETILKGNVLTVRIPRCPAVTHLVSKGHDIPPYYDGTTLVVYEEICRDTGVRFVLDEYDRRTGRCAMRFIKGGLSS